MQPWVWTQKKSTAFKVTALLWGGIYRIGEFRVAADSRFLTLGTMEAVMSVMSIFLEA